MTTERVQELTRLVRDPAVPDAEAIAAAGELRRLALAPDPDEPPIKQQLEALRAKLDALEAAGRIGRRKKGAA